MEPSLQEKLSLTTLAVLLSITPLFAGGRDLFGFLFVIICILPLVFFLRKSSLVPPITNKFVLLFGVFLLFAAVSTATSMNFFISFQSLLWWFIYFFIFTASVALFQKKENAEIAFKVLIGSAVLVGLIGIGYFLFDTTGYLRLRSIFGQHNALGGFFLFPVFLSLGYFAGAVEKSTKWLWGSVSVFMLIVAILTFSRGTYLSLLLAGAVVLAVSYKRGSGKAILSILGKTLFVGVIAAVFAAAIFYLNGYLQKKETSPNQIYAGETAETNSRTLRIAYWNDAKEVIEEKFLLGVGPGNYVTGNRVYRQPAGYFTTDPHNLYLKLLAEVGVGSVSLLIFFLLLGILGLKQLRKSGNDFFMISAVGGIFALLIHNGMDIDWTYPANAMVFFAAAGALVAMTPMKEGSKKWFNGVCVAAVIVAVCGYLVFTSLNRVEDGKYFVAKSKNDLAKEMLVSADARNFFKNAEIPYLIADVDDDVALIDRAISLAPHEARYYAKKAEILNQKGDTSGEENALVRSIELNRGASHDQLLTLSNLYIKQKKYKESKEIITQVLPWIVGYVESGFFATDPNKAHIANTAEKIKANLLISEKGAQ